MLIPFDFEILEKFLAASARQVGYRSLSSLVSRNAELTKATGFALDLPGPILLDLVPELELEVRSEARKMVQGRASRRAAFASTDGSAGASPCRCRMT